MSFAGAARTAIQAEVLSNKHASLPTALVHAY